MQGGNWLFILLMSMMSLAIGIGAGVIIARLYRKRDTQIKELEARLAQGKKEFEDYRKQVNEHFLSTSDLFDQMTASYRAVFLHQIQGAQALCDTETEATRLKLAGGKLFAVAQPGNVVPTVNSAAMEAIESEKKTDNPVIETEIETKAAEEQDCTGIEREIEERLSDEQVKVLASDESEMEQLDQQNAIEAEEKDQQSASEATEKTDLKSESPTQYSPSKNENIQLLR